jgi:thioredoxin reductase (NADPH)
MKSIEMTDIPIIGAGPTGLFCLKLFKIIKCHILDALPQVAVNFQNYIQKKPIYDIPDFRRS